MQNLTRDEVIEVAFSEALECIAIGETREATRGYVMDSHPGLSVDEVNDILADAIRDARKQGIEREDIDPSWF